MSIAHNPFLSKPFLKSIWALEYKAYKAEGKDAEILNILKLWSQRADLKETSAESAFIDTFFKSLWGYTQAGQNDEAQFTLYPQHSISGGGMGGGTGKADLAMGVFGSEDVPPVPQVLCEFKDIKSNLDAPQKSRKQNPRSPVKQCLDYLSAARRGMFGNESVLPTWGIVTDMNEFRLYWYDRAPQQYFRFVIRPIELFQGAGLLANDDNAKFDRFLFWRLFHSESLITTGGRSKLAQLLARQWVQERDLEKAFYKEYRAFRDKLYNSLIKHNPQFSGTKGRLVRLAQKILDRFIFIFFCEDMGNALSFPPQILRDFLIHESKDEYYDPNGGTIWARMLGLFQSMNEGQPFGGKKINQFNGGLFADDQELEGLKLPNSLFCVNGQGQNEASLNADKETLLYLSATYNYASDIAEGLTTLPLEEIDPAKALKSDPARSLGLYTLGRIFEQSITELEILEAEADGFLSINKESGRKTDGVYYTPEWVVEFIVAKTVGARLDDMKAEVGWPEKGMPDIKVLDEYQKKLKSIKIVDPACGSGAFLITVLRYLMDEWAMVFALRRDISGTATKHDDAALIKDILKRNIYGVDINPSSVEITRLALWLHTASGNKPLSSLDSTIRDGNSLVNSDFYKGQANMDFYDDVQKERVNVFDWDTAFPEVFANGGFDCVVGNPPYVKLQNFHKVHSDMADFLKKDRLGNLTYMSTQTGNFDLYLPFIEKGLQILNVNGRLGYIAPSLWTVNEYGEALRDLLLKTRQLERWVDFKAFQVFDEAITYTALQFYTKKPNLRVRVAVSINGTLGDDPWDGINTDVEYSDLPFDDRWLLVSGKERKLMNKLLKKSARLGDKEVTEGICQGLITSADPIYHLDYIGPGKYLCTPKGTTKHAYEVEIEDKLMKPLVSGGEAKRYESPKTKTYLLFPYENTGGSIKLIPVEEMQTNYPKAFKHLLSYEDELRKREGGKFNDDDWYRFGRNQNMDKQEIQKLIVAQTVPSLRVCYDSNASVYLNNVRVNGILPAKGVNPWFLLGILNSAVCNFVFTRIGKVKAGGYYEANKQFIAPLPIPTGTTKEIEAVASLAQALQALHTQKRDVLERIDKRMQVVKVKPRSESFLFPALGSVIERESSAPKGLDSKTRSAWAKQKYLEDLQSKYDEITPRLKSSAVIDVVFQDGELKLFIDGVPILNDIFLGKEDGFFILAQWKVLAQTFSITEKTDGKKLCDALRKIGETDNPDLVKQIIKLENELSALDQEINSKENEINLTSYKLYGLTDSEIKLVKADK